MRRLLSKIKQKLKHKMMPVAGQFIEDPIERARVTGFFRAEDIELITDIFFKEGSTPGGRWDALLHAHMELPSWFRQGLDPLSPEYAAQQQRLWQLVSGVERPYEPEVDEKEVPLTGVDPVRLPAFYMRRDADAVRSASDHVIAGGMLLKHSGLKPGDWALEYGAGFGQTALSLARLGVNVDTVDISQAFCEAVRAQAEFFQVQLTPHHARFGSNPRPGQKYQLIWFYEAFHHCLDFQQLLRELPEHLAEGGRIVLSGEPMVEREYAAVPYPWGVRLHSEVVAVVRRMHWFELGFSEDFLYEIFTHAGFTIERIRCEPTLFGRLYVCQRRPAELHFGTQWLPPVLEDGWNPPEEDGRWTRGDARLALDPAANGHAELDLANLLGGRQRVTLEAGDFSTTVTLAPGERRTLRWPCAGAKWLTLRCATRRAALWRRLRRADHRALGIFVRRLRYDTTASAG